MEEPRLTVGKTRIRHKSTGSIGTVAYVGPVASALDANEVYVGIVWDDPSVGKHDGSVLSRTTGQWVRHFTAPHPTAGSFLRPHLVDTGVPLTQTLLWQRYVPLHSDECLAPGNLLPHTAQTASGRNDKPIELIGEMKIRSQQQLPDLSTVSLRWSGISSIEAPTTTLASSETIHHRANDSKDHEDLRRMEHSEPLWSNLHHLTTVDLAGNLICDWQDVIHLLQHLPQLENLNLAGNHLGDLPLECPQTDSGGNRWTHPLSHLNLTHSRLQSVESCLKLGTLLPQLQDLALSHSSLPDIQAERHRPLLAQAFPCLSMLDLSSCRLQNEQVMAWADLPRLAWLSLDDNEELTDLGTRDPGAWRPGDFAVLEHLQIAGTGVNQWEILDRIYPCLHPHLTSLRCKQCPLTASLGVGEARLYMLALMPSLQLLNASAVSVLERKEAARWYLTTQTKRRPLEQQQQHHQGETKLIPDEEKSNSPAEQSVDDEEKLQFKIWKEQFPEIVMHVSGMGSEAAPGVGSGFTDSRLIDSIVNVSIRSMAANSCTMEPLIRRLPSQLTIGRLKALCARQFGLSIDLQTLHFRRSEHDLPVALDGDERTLAYYGLADGTEILMDEIDLDALRREEQRIASDFEQRLERQEREIEALQDQQKRIGNVVNTNTKQ